MSGFLSRLAARSCGAAAGVSALNPRVPALFEQPEVVGAEASPIAEAVAPTPVTGPTSPQKQASAPTVATPAAPRAEPANEPSDAAPQPVPPPLPVATAAAVVDVVAEAAAAMPAPVHRTVDPEPAAPRTHPVSAVPAEPTPPPPRAMVVAPEPERPAERTPDVVHVSIGRVEIRTATTAPAKPVRVAADTSEATGPAKTLSLADYLRGERVRR
jgi:hypothetical protein